ncbi:MAG: YncE family protein [Prolixibacteraceae bacterium]|nr:YncE family protein [Prolixibacteraceae bacterium]
MKNLISIICIAVLLSSSLFSGAQSTYKVVNQIHLEGDGGWDYLTVDEAAGRLYVSHSSMALVVDLKTGKQIGKIEGTNGIHGIAIATSLNKGFTSNGRDSSVTVFNLKTLEITGKIKVTGKNPDAILYDAFSGKLFTFNGRSANATVIDPKLNKVIGTIQLYGKPEFPASDGKGKIFVNIEDKSEISVINANTLKVEKTWSITPGEEPSGLALDNETHRLFSVCSNKLMVVSDAEAGTVETSLPIGGGCDGVAFDPALKRAYSSNGEGTITVVQEENKDSFKVIETIVSQRGARTIAVDKTTHHLYLSTAEFGEAIEGSRRPPMKPGTFMVLDVAPVK